MQPAEHFKTYFNFLNCQHLTYYFQLNDNKIKKLLNNYTVLNEEVDTLDNECKKITFWSTKLLDRVVSFFVTKQHIILFKHIAKYYKITNRH